MTTALPAPISPLRQRLIEDMNMRRFSMRMQRNYVRDASRSVTFWLAARYGDAENLRRFQIEQRDAGTASASRCASSSRPRSNGRISPATLSCIRVTTLWSGLTVKSRGSTLATCFTV